MNPSFKHLDAKLRIADLTIRQWIGILLGGIGALLYADLVHPFGTMVTMVSAVYVGGIPIAAVLLAGSSEFDAWLVLRSAWSWRAEDERYLPGPGAATKGYVVHAAVDDYLYPDQDPLMELDPAGLWGER
jgi:hypothetical protein